MKTRLVSLSLVSVLIAIIIAISGCCICCNWQGQEHYERSESLSAPMAGIEQIQVDTSFGEVHVTGTDTAECNIAAQIKGGAPTMDEARQIVEQTKITLEAEGKILVVKIEKPHLKNNRSIGVDFDITVPVKTGVNCKTSFGEVELENIEGDVFAHSSFGEIKANNITGKMQLATSYGKVDCRGITTGDFSAKSSFGEVKVVFSDSCPADMKAKIETSYGEINADIPSNFAGDIAVETSFGSIKSDLPITVKGEIGKTHIKGTIGQGNGSLDLKTSFGSVKIK